MSSPAEWEPRPRSGREFLKAARQRLLAAELLFRHHHTLDAVYLSGYAVECALKALIIESTLPAAREDTITRITRTAQMHFPEVLIGELKDRRVGVPLELAKRLARRRMRWSTALRYGTGRRDRGETKYVLDLSAQTIAWVAGQEVMQ